MALEARDTRMDPLNLSDLKKLSDEATPGPWHGCVGDELDHWELYNPETGEHVVQDDSGVDPRAEDIEFICAARTYLPKLIAVAEAARKLADDAYHVDETLVADVYETLAALESECP